MKCCNQECATPFCPHCGAQTSADRLVGLRKHLRGSLATHLATIERFSRDQSRSDTPEKYEPRIKRCRTTIAKWESWILGLDELLASVKTQPTLLTAQAYSVRYSEKDE